MEKRRSVPAESDPAPELAPAADLKDPSGKSIESRANLNRVVSRSLLTLLVSFDPMGHGGSGCVWPYIIMIAALSMGTFIFFGSPFFLHRKIYLAAVEH